MSSRDEGTTLVELLVVVVLLVSLAAMTVPLTANVVDAGRVRQASSFMASEFRLARHRAIFTERSVGVVFDLTAEGWAIRVCEDGNGNGIRRAELTSGADVCFDGPHLMAALFPTVSVAIDPGIRDPSGGTGSSDPVRFGRSDLVSFSPNGSCTPGSLYLQSAQGQQYAVRVNGALGRLRVLRYDPAAAVWVDP